MTVVWLEKWAGILCPFMWEGSYSVLVAQAYSKAQSLWNWTLFHMKGPFILSCGSGFLCTFSKSWSFTGCTLKSFSSSALDKARSPPSLAWSTSSDVANWPVAMLMSLVLSWNGLIIFSSRTDQSLCNVSHFFKAVLSSESTLSVMWAILRVSLDIAVITRRAFRYLATAACFLLCQKTALSWHLCWLSVLEPYTAQTPLNFSSFLHTVKFPIWNSFDTCRKTLHGCYELWNTGSILHMPSRDKVRSISSTVAKCKVQLPDRSAYRCTSWLCPSFPNT